MKLNEYDLLGTALTGSGMFLAFIVGLSIQMPITILAAVGLTAAGTYCAVIGYVNRVVVPQLETKVETRKVTNNDLRIVYLRMDAIDLLQRMYPSAGIYDLMTNKELEQKLVDSGHIPRGTEIQVV